MVLHFINDGIRTTFVTLLPFIAKDLSLNLSSVGFLGSTQALLASFLSIPAGFLAARFGGLHFLTLLLIIYSFGSLGVALSDNLPFIILSFSLGAIGFGMFHTVAFSQVAKMSAKNSVGKNMGNFTSIGDIGRVCIPPLAVFAVPVLGWRQNFIILAVIGFLAFVLLKTVLLKKEGINFEKKEINENHMDFIKGILKLLKTKKLLLTLGAAILDSLASSPIYIFLPFLLFAKHIKITEYGIATSLFLAGSLAGKYLLGRLVDKKGNLKVFIASEIFMAISLILLVIFNNFYLILFISFLLGVFTRGTTPVIQSMFSEISHRDHYDKVFALSELFIGAAAVLIIFLMGLTADKLGVVFVFYASSVFALLATLPVFALSKYLKNIPNAVLFVKR